METKLTAVELARSLAEVLMRVQQGGESFVVEHNGAAVCHLVPAGPRPFTTTDLARLLDGLPRPDKAYLDAVEALAQQQSASTLSSRDAL